MSAEPSNIFKTVGQMAAASLKPREAKSEIIPAHSVDLPSGGVFYNGEKSVRVAQALSVSQVQQLYGIRAMTSEYNKKRELINVIGGSIRDVEWLDLTWPDFQYIMYWIRLNTYKPNPYHVQWSYKPEGSEVQKSVSSMVYLKDFRLHVLNRHKKFPYEYMTVRMYLELLELEEEKDKFIGKFAVSYPRGNTLQERMEALKPQSSDILLEIRDFQVAAAHGIDTIVKLTDPENPGAGFFEYSLEIDVEDFFP